MTLLAALLLAAPLYAAAGPQDVTGVAQLMRQTWATQKVPTMTSVQRVYSRTVSFALPRAFVIGYQAERADYFIAEYVPDGETVEKWTRMITVTGTFGLGGAHLDDDVLADTTYNRMHCEGKVYRDFGAVAALMLPYRALMIGCAGEGDAGSERGAIAFFRDADHGWSVQYAERGALTKGFEARAVTALAALQPGLSCKDDDKSKDCQAK